MNKPVINYFELALKNWQKHIDSQTVVGLDKELTVYVDEGADLLWKRAGDTLEIYNMEAMQIDYVAPLEKQRDEALTPKCECGAQAVRHSSHSSWCPIK